MFLLASTARNHSQSKAIAVERAYEVGMNTKETVILAIKSGARTGFNEYDATHFVAACTHCMDYACSLLPESPNFCDPVMCKLCFREGDARSAAEQGALQTLSGLYGTKFDDDFDTSFDPTSASSLEVECFLAPSAFAKNGFIADFVRLKNPIELNAIGFGVESTTKLPKGLVIELG